MLFWERRHCYSDFKTEMALLFLPDLKKTTHSPKYELVKSYYDRGLWNADRVRRAVTCHWITQDECDEILSGV